MGFFGNLLAKKGRSEDMRAALSIGASGIRGLLFSHAGDAALTLHASVHIPTPPGKGASASGTLVLDGGSLEKLVQSMLEKNPAFAGVKSVYAGLSGEFLRSSMFRAVFEREHAPEKIDQAEFKNLLEKAERASRENLAEHITRQSGRGVELRLLSSKLEEVLVDGYAVSDPVGFSGKEVEIALFNLYAEEPYVVFLQDVKKLLGAQKMFPHASAYVVARSLIRASAADFSGVCIEAEDVLTNVAVVSKNTFLGAKPFSIGAKLFTRALAAQMHLGFAQAQDMKQQYSAGKLSAPVSRKVSGTFKRAASVWGSGVELALEEFAASVELFPSAFYLYGEGADLPDLVRTLEEAGRFSGIPFLEKRTYAVLTPQTLPYAGVWASEQAAIPLIAGDVVPLSLAYLSLENPDEHSELTRIVERATKLAYS